ncbi:MAG: enoyl-CoA hydratase-related protein [Pseudomonadales bacterium]
MPDVLLKENRDGVLILTLNRPEKKNALNIPMWEGLRDIFLEANEDPRVRVVVLTANGDNFCAGVDLNDFNNADKSHPFGAAARAIANFEKPLIGAVCGAAVGGGATILFHCDVVYVGESLRMRLPFVNLGVVPEFASSYLLQVNIGAQRAAELMYTAEWINAERALQTGIAADSFADDQVLPHALEKAAQMAQWPVNSLRETKRCLKAPHKDAIAAAFEVEDEAMYRQAGSPENVEAIMAFLEKRAPDFAKLIED